MSGSPLRPRLWMVFAALAAATLVLTLFGLGLVRVYDNQLVRSTESELIAQGAALGNAFREVVGRQAEPPPCQAPALPWPFPVPNDRLRPILPTLNGSSKVKPPPAEPPRAVSPVHPSLAAAGRAFESMLVQTSGATLASLRIVDLAGTVVSSSSSQLGLNLGGSPEVQRALGGAPASVLKARLGEPPDSTLASLSRDTGVRVFVALPIFDGDCVIGAVVLARTPMTLAKATYADRWNFAASGTVLVVALALASLLAAAFVLRPIRRLVARANAIRAGASLGSLTGGAPLIAELFALFESLDAMARTLAERNDALRAFAASVSHEFKTPLASIRGALELLQEDQGAMPPEQRSRFMSNVSKDADRLTRLVQRLLELAKAESSGQGVDGCEPLQTARQAAGGDPRISIRGVEGWVAVPQEALLAVLGHLLENSFQHGGRAVSLTVTARDLAVSDDGPGIGEANRARVFERFFTTARESGGTGMGLSIARALMRAFGGELLLDPPSGSGGATFRLVFPERGSRP